MSGKTTKMLVEVERLQREQGARPFVVMDTYRMCEYAAALLQHLGGDPRRVGWIAANQRWYWIDQKLRGSNEPLFIDHSAHLTFASYDVVHDYLQRRELRLASRT